MKIQGHRIELGEIETSLKAHPEIVDAVVIARGDAGTSQSLVAYVTQKVGLAAATEDPRGTGVLTNEADRVVFKLAEHNIRRDGPETSRVPPPRTWPKS